LEEAAYIDGASVLRTFISIVLPVSKALIGVMVLYFAVGHWNSYFNAMVYTYDEALQPLQLVLRKILILQTSSAQMMASSGADELAAEQQQIASLIQYAVIVVSSLPLLIIYPFLQKYFDKGVMLGSVKG
jgi:putative aldouronate transport system permease protein